MGLGLEGGPLGATFGVENGQILPAPPYTLPAPP